MFGILGALAITARSSFELGYHRDLTRRATSGLSADAQRLIINANLFVDIRSAFLLILGRRDRPVSRMHFDDCFGQSAFRERWEEVEAPLIALATSSPRRLARAIGRAQHSGQDYYAHSNHVEQVTSRNPSSFEPVTYASVVDELGGEDVRDQWEGEGAGSIATSLVSGAFLTTAPRVVDDRGQPQELHHRTLHKDRPTVKGAYLYWDFDRTTMHFRARACAGLESTRLMVLAEEAHPAEFAALREYRSAAGEKILETLKYWFAVVAGVLTGHWR